MTPHRQLSRKRIALLKSCDDCGKSSTAHFWQKAGRLSASTQAEAERRGFTMDLCADCDTGVSSSIWQRRSAGGAL